jgi:TolB-like protein/class 3 adenylate cyclase
VSEEGVERRLTTILAADVVGYSRLMAADEVGTLASLKSHRAELFDPKAAQYHGRTIKLMGDGTLMEFASVVDAVSFAVEVQCAMQERNADIPEDRRITYRIGINIGDIIVEGDDIYGDGVNITARLEGLAEPGGVCISRPVHTQIKGKLDLTFEDLGAKEVKNIPEPVTVFRVALDERAAALVTPVVQETAQPEHRWWPVVAALVAVLVLAVGGVLWWQPWTPDVEPASTRALSDKPSIAVLPFDNMSGDPDMDYFSDGMTEDIITELSKNPDLKVASRSSSFTYRDQAVKVRRVGEELGVRYVLEGSVRKQGDTVRITAQLIDATTDAHIWADRFDEEGTDIFALQDRITEKIAATLGGGTGRIRRAEYERVWEMDAAKLEEYDYYLRGHSIFFGFTPEAMLKARQIWQEGLRKFPESGLLRVKIGWTHFQFFIFGWSTEPDKDLEQAYQWAQEGLTDQNMPPAGRWNGHWLNALVHLYHKRDYDTALDEAMKTLEIIPNDPTTLVSLAAVPIFAGKPDLAIEWVNRAMRRETPVPDWFYMHLGLAYHGKGDCDRAVEQHEKVPWPALDKSTSQAACYIELGRIDDAKAELARMLEACPEVTITRTNLHLPYRDLALLGRVHAALGTAGLPE